MAILTDARRFTEELKVISTKFCADHPFLLSSEGRNRLNSLLSALRETNSISIFLPWLKDAMLKFPPLEVLWLLDKNGCLKITTFLTCRPNQYLVVVGILVKILFSSGSIDTVEDSSKSNVATILVDVLSAFLNLWDPIDKSLPATPWINSFMEQVLSKLSNDADLSFSYLDQLALTGHVSPSTLRMFAVYHLKQMIDYRADSFDVMTACSIHTKKWTAKSMSDTNQQFYKQLVLMLPDDILFEELQDAVPKNCLNWKFVLVLISSYAMLTPENGEKMKSQLDEWFKEAVSSLNRELLVFSLLGLRQCCWEGSIRCFPSYPSWFVSLQLKTSTAFTFFFSVLTELVPYEPAIHLKMHVNKVPAVPANCQPILVDYLTLAKTRLADLNQTTDCIGLFNDYHDFDVEGLESDIARVVTCLRDTNELPKPLLEAFVFRRQYYEKVFLPRLLSIPEREDLARAQVIRKLSSMGKISQSLFGNWVNL